MFSILIDTHDKKVVVVLFKDGKAIDVYEEQSVNKHSVVTLPSIRNILEKNNILINDINEVFVVNGPGSFTGVRIAVTIGKTIAYLLNIPIKVIDALSLIAINVKLSNKYVSIEDRNGAFVGEFDSNNNLVNDIKYVNKEEYNELSSKNEYISDIEIDYNLIYDYLSNKPVLNAHEVKPFYVKGISVLNDKKC